MNINVTKLLLTSASALFLLSQSAVAMVSDDGAPAANSGTVKVVRAATAAEIAEAEHARKSYPDAGAVTPERAASYPCIKGRRWNCLEQEEFENSLKLPEIGPFEVLLSYGWSRFPSPNEAEEIANALMPKPKRSDTYERRQHYGEKLAELDREMSQRIAQATQTEQEELRAAQRALEEECAPYQREIDKQLAVKEKWCATTAQARAAGMNTWDGIDARDSNDRIKHFEAKIANCNNPNSFPVVLIEARKRELEKAQRKERLLVETEQAPQRRQLALEAGVDALIDAYRSTVFRTLDEFYEGIRAHLKPIQQRVEGRIIDLRDSRAYANLLQAFLVQKQNEEKARVAAGGDE